MPTRLNASLGEFLRSRRERLKPKAVGLHGSRRRRTSGLRRQEVAELAGIGVDWYIRLEQGRAVTPSETTVDSLARALRLTKTEHAHLRALARSGKRAAVGPELVPSAVARMVVCLPHPAYVTGQRWDLLVWNDAAIDMFPLLRTLDGEDRNVLVYMFLHAEARERFGDAWAEEARRIIAQFRASYDLWAADPAFVELVTRLRSGSPEFALWWESHDVAAPGSGTKVLWHPGRGSIRYIYANFQVSDAPALKLSLYIPE
jgi:transcriptional regulator with XRE-family HTH domain